MKAQIIFGLAAALVSGSVLAGPDACIYTSEKEGPSRHAMDKFARNFERHSAEFEVKHNMKKCDSDTLIFDFKHNEKAMHAVVREYCDAETLFQVGGIVSCEAK
ncbi:hypothetical protein [Agarivorans gilvus]|uniref:DUF3718 domain-containing protein n=1 Tax=Agarivorans gilvus TaxID=680279 RepID=A0ABQ1I0Q3_9ALTE|nr:hypothetical protein [Agarivorans gilvus]GGB05397.1 hypothetical protein GCM10007414_18410 [Agarivorans gilvus]